MTGTFKINPTLLKDFQKTPFIIRSEYFEFFYTQNSDSSTFGHNSIQLLKIINIFRIKKE